MSLLVRRCLTRTHLVEQLVETWQFDHKAAMGARDLEELVSECLDLARLSRRAWDAVVEELFDEQVRSYRVFADEDLVKLSVQRTIAVFKAVQKLIVLAEHSGYSIEGAADFRQAILDLVSLQKQAQEQWPPMDPELIQESIAQYKRGEFRFAEDLLHELQGGDDSTAEGHLILPGVQHISRKSS